ncbi:tetratricopeptide repeat protein [Altererythrobacter litoralis]|uniref:Tetratricopeptide repeat protein n=1 Tax=Altererythrobacter litoralis TaxID=3113904 RepID=A0ABU7GJV7_9SPHN|nr:tetratricopeptide repeat protein [Erythrobacteraceae bacterium 1XM1-14]
MKKTIGICTLIYAGSALQAETLPVEGIFAGEANIDARVQTIAFEGFGGDAGPELSFLLSDILSAVEINGQPWFAIVPAATLAELHSGVNEDAEGKAIDTGPTAVLQGSARTEFWEESAGVKKVISCGKKERGDCVEKRKEVYDCHLLSVGYRPMLRLVASDGTLLYESNKYLKTYQKYCEDEAAAPNPDDLLNSLAAQYAYSVRVDLAPQFRSDKFRISENRKGMSGDDARSFKKAIQLTKSDQLAACVAFNELEAANPAHVSVLLNIGLCHESQGDLQLARDYYNRTLDLNSGKDEAQAGLDRVVSRLIARQQVSEHFSSY